MKKIFSLFFLFIILNSASETTMVFKENNSIDYSLYTINTINNSVNTNNIFEVFNGICIHGVYINNEFYIFTNHDLNKNIDELKRKLNISVINISKIEIYANKNELNQLLENNFLFLE